MCICQGTIVHGIQHKSGLINAWTFCPDRFAAGVDESGSRPRWRRTLPVETVSDSGLVSQPVSAVVAPHDSRCHTSSTPCTVLGLPRRLSRLCLTAAPVSRTCRQHPRSTVSHRAGVSPRLTAEPGVLVGSPGALIIPRGVA